MDHRVFVFDRDYITPLDAALAMVDGLALAVRRAHEQDLSVEGVVVPAVGVVVAAVIAASELDGRGVVKRDGSLIDAWRSSFSVFGIPIFFAGSDGGIEPFAITRRPHRGI
jgi:hypothetical protein